MALQIELWQARALRVGDIVYALEYFEHDGSPQKFVVTAEPKLWKRNHERVEVSLARRQETIIMTELCLCEFSLDKPDPVRKPKMM